MNKTVENVNETAFSFWASAIMVIEAQSSAFLRKRTKCKNTHVTNVDAMRAEINTPITVRMTDHNLKNIIYQRNKGY